MNCTKSKYITIISTVAILFYNSVLVMAQDNKIVEDNHKPVAVSVIDGELYMLKGTVIAAELCDDISSKFCKTNDVIYLKLLQNIVINGKIVATKGANVIGHIQEAKNASGFGNSGKISIEVDYLETDNHVKIPLQYSEKHTRGSQDDAIGIAIGNFIIGGLFVKGNDIKIPMKTVIKAVVLADCGLGIKK